MRVNDIRNGFLQASEALCQNRAGGGVQPLQIRYALEDLRRHCGAQRTNTVKTEGMVTAKRVFHLGHGFLKTVPFLQKHPKGIVPQRKSPITLSGAL